MIPFIFHWESTILQMKIYIQGVYFLHTSDIVVVITTAQLSALRHTSPKVDNAGADVTLQSAKNIVITEIVVTNTVSCFM